MNKSKTTFVHQKLSVTSQSSIKLDCYLIWPEKYLEADIKQSIIRLPDADTFQRQKYVCFETLQLPQIKSRLQRSIDFPIITTPLFLFPQHNLRPIVASVLISLNFSVINTWLPSAKNILTLTYLFKKREQLSASSS